MFIMINHESLGNGLHHYILPKKTVLLPSMGDYTSQYIGDYPYWEIPFNQPERWNDTGKLNTAQMKIDKFTDKNGIQRDLSQQGHLARSRSPLQPCSIHGPHGLYVLKNTDASDRMLQ